MNNNNNNNIKIWQALVAVLSLAFTIMVTYYSTRLSDAADKAVIKSELQTINKSIDELKVTIKENYADTKKDIEATNKRLDNHINNQSNMSKK